MATFAGSIHRKIIVKEIQKKFKYKIFTSGNDYLFFATPASNSLNVYFSYINDALINYNILWRITPYKLVERIIDGTFLTSHLKIWILVLNYFIKKNNIYYSFPEEAILYFEDIINTIKDILIKIGFLSKNQSIIVTKEELNRLKENIDVENQHIFNENNFIKNKPFDYYEKFDTKNNIKNNIKNDSNENDTKNNIKNDLNENDTNDSINNNFDISKEENNKKNKFFDLNDNFEEKKEIID